MLVAGLPPHSVVVTAEEVALSRPAANLNGQLRDLLEPALRSASYDLEELTATLAGRRRVIRVIVDRDGGLTLDDVAEVSHSVSDLLDEAEVLGETPYVLEVSSPGVDRPLREPRHWRRAVGRLVTVNVARERSVTARIVAADQDGVVLRPSGDGPAGADRLLPYADLGPGAVQVEFGRPTSDEADLPDDEPAGLS